jgi:hypothetical protein
MHRVEAILQYLEGLKRRFSANRYLNTGAKTLVTVLLLGFLYYEITSNDRLEDVWAAFLLHLDGANTGWLMGALFLMPLNWLAETEKWRQFVSRYEPISRTRALLAVMTGVTFSLFTPNRIGEYGGRMLYVHPDNQWRAVVANLVGNFCQFMVLVGMGVLGSLYILGHFEWMDRAWSLILIALATLSLPALFWVYYHFEVVIDFIKRLASVSPFLPLLKRLNLGVLRQFSKAERTSILLWAILRFFIYATQYYMLLRFFGINTGLIGGFAGISSLFLLQTSIPLPPLSGLVARGNLAVLLWQQFGANDVAALAATFTLWVINLVLPALIGTFSFFYVNISKSLGYEDAPNQDDPEAPVRAPAAERSA